jgi:sugar phosphate isomerase/epimerase
MNPNQDRRSFIKTTTGLLAAGMSGFGFSANKKDLLLSFSTLGCPDWPYDKIIRFAAENKYKGIEIRGIQRELNLPKASPFNSPQQINASKKMAKDAGISIVNLGASSALHHPAGAERTKSIEEAKQFIDLAQTLDCPYIRVFPNNLPKDQGKQSTLDLIKQGLIILGDHAKGSKVTVLMETHGDVVYTADLMNIMQDLNHPQVGLVWDIVNMWSVTKETPAEVYPKLKPYIRHTHIKDFRMKDGKMQYTLLGRGESPIYQAIDLLRKDGYKGYYSFEWEKLWHPEIEEPEVALSAYASAMKYLK